MPFGKEEFSTGIPLWISTACQVVKVPGWVLLWRQQPLYTEYRCHLVLLLGNCTFHILLTGGRNGHLPGTWPPGELSIPIAHAPLDETCVKQHFPVLTLSTEADHGDESTTSPVMGSAVWRVYWLSIIWSDIFPPFRVKVTFFSDCSLTLVARLPFVSSSVCLSWNSGLSQTLFSSACSSHYSPLSTID